MSVVVLFPEAPDPHSLIGESELLVGVLRLHADALHVAADTIAAARSQMERSAGRAKASATLALDALIEPYRAGDAADYLQKLPENRDGLP